MKIAIAATNKEKSAQISDQGGRAPYYLIFDEKGILLEKIKNPFAVGGGGAGFAVAKMMQNKDVDIVVAGTIGEKMAKALEERKIKWYVKKGIASQIIQEIKSNAK